MRSLQEMILRRLYLPNPAIDFESDLFWASNDKSIANAIENTPQTEFFLLYFKGVWEASNGGKCPFSAVEDFAFCREMVY